MAAAALAERLGIGIRSCRGQDGSWKVGAQLGRTAIVWDTNGTDEAVLGVPTMGISPIFNSAQGWGCSWFAPVTADQPTGAIQVVRVSALVSDFESTGMVWGWREPLLFGAPFDIPWLGARAREARVDHGWVRMIQPVEPDGLAARWLADGGPSWLGFTIEVSDLGQAADVLKRRGVRVLEATDWKRPMLVVEPDQAGGAVVEFVQGAAF